MAIGLGAMIGLKFPENFNYPYISKSIQEFWRRWHMTLSGWFKDYLYIPLGGSKTSNFLTYRNLFAVFVLCGLWHGANWTFIVWGMYHGFFLVIERLGFKKVVSKNSIVAHLYTILVFIVGWVIFRADNIAYSVKYLKAMFLNTKWTSPFVAYSCDVKYYVILIIASILSFGIYNRIIESNKFKRINYIEDIILIVLFVFGCSSIMIDSNNPFLYFRF